MSNQDGNAFTVSTTPLIKQIETSSQALLDFEVFCKKRSDLEAQYSAKLAAFHKEFAIGYGIKFGAEKSTIGDILTEIADGITLSQVTAHTQISKSIGDLCVQCNTFSEQLQKTKKKLLEQEKHLIDDRTALYDSLEKQKNSYHKTIKSSDAKKSIKTSLNYNVQISRVREFQLHYKKTYQDILNDFESSEIGRVSIVKNLFGQYLGGILNSYEPCFAQINELLAKSNAIDDENQCLLNTDNLTRQEILVKKIEFESLPKSLKDKKRRLTIKIKKKDSRSRSKEIKYGEKEVLDENRTTYGVALEQMMLDQKGSFPRLKVPFILQYLIGRIKELGGMETEGIFRISANANVVQENVQLLNSSRPGATVDLIFNPHIVAGLLKLWIRKIPGGLVPSDLYYQAINSETEEHTMWNFSTFPQVNQECIRAIADLINEMSKEPYVSESKMTLQNLALIFGPAICNCPDEDPQIVASNSAEEINFVCTVCKEVAENPRLSESSDQVIQIEDYNYQINDPNRRYSLPDIPFKKKKLPTVPSKVSPFIETIQIKDSIEPDYSEPNYSEPDYSEPNYSETDYSEPNYSETLPEPVTFRDSSSFPPPIVDENGQ